jgi:S-DNA-T family DNA segregation ATPase FtsK/SpoIIIE
MYELQQIFRAYKVPATIFEKTEGCRITTYKFALHNGARILSVSQILTEIGVKLGAESIRLIEIPEENSFGIEVSSRDVRPVRLGDILRSDEFVSSNKRLKFALGETPNGQKIVGSLAEARNMLIGGCQGSGKSVFINVLILSLMKEDPSDLRFVLIDPKKVELSRYEDIPHLYVPVLTEPKQIQNTLVWLEGEMEERYSFLNKVSGGDNGTFASIDEFNEALKYRNSDEEYQRHKRPKIVVVIDEMAQLFITPRSSDDFGVMYGGDHIRNSVTKIAQLGRAAGIHLIAATQNPKAEIVNTLLRGNFSTKVSFKVTSESNSRIILDESGAEKLLGRGDMLYMQEDDFEPRRIQGAFVSGSEIDKVVNSIRDNNDSVKYDVLAMWYRNGFAAIYAALLKKGYTSDEAFEKIKDILNQCNGNNGKRILGSCDDIEYDDYVDWVIR